MTHGQTYMDLRHDLFRVCEFITANSLLSNFLPRSTFLRSHTRFRCAYEIFVDLVAGFALNWRTQLPSLDQEFIGFKRTFRHGYRNWKQAHEDRKYIR